MDLIFNLLIFASMILGGMFVIFLPFGLYKDHEIRQDILKFSEGQYFSLYAFQKLTQTYLDSMDPFATSIRLRECFEKIKVRDINLFNKFDNNLLKKIGLEKNKWWKFW